MKIRLRRTICQLEQLGASIVIALLIFKVSSLQGMAQATSHVASSSRQEKHPADADSPQRKSSVLRLGMPYRAVHAMFGNPVAYYMRGKLYKTLPRLISGSVQDVYFRKHGETVYQVRIGYEIDVNGSRLNPSLIVSYVHFAFDMPLPAKSALKLIPEVSRICAVKCEAYAYQSGRDRHVWLAEPEDMKPDTAFELSWVGADGFTEHAVINLDDQLTDIDMYTRELDRRYSFDPPLQEWSSNQ